MNTKPIGLIAGEGKLPQLIANGIHNSGKEVACIGLKNYYHKDLPNHCDYFKEVGPFRIGQWIRTLKKWKISKAIMVGRVQKKQMYDPRRFFNQLPDIKTLSLWYFSLKHDKRSPAVLNALTEELNKRGIQLIDSTSYIQDHLAEVGTLGCHEPKKENLSDISFAWPILNKINSLKIGQAITVKGKDIIAVEALEGTDAMIERTGKLCKKGGWTLVKTANENHDMRTDVPTIGINTIEKVYGNGGNTIAIGAKKTILVEKEKTINLANKLGICLIGI